ncbi:hypothetical protein NDU88_001238 [Pleurodeles waltl]|uniref:Uncharacterized protein n=1 Tax=Pleurodeles waltl TaxID=8319 RepID=A0AAV7Q6H3_PLEWA|nr:hypothetical protein NDU88_001238 [Pleurodeles waltl]
MASDPLSSVRASTFNTIIKLDQKLKAIAATRQYLSTKVDAVAIELGPLRANQQTLTSRVNQMENEITELQLTVHDLEGQIPSITSKVCEPEPRTEDSEARSCCNNLGIVGFPEGAEGNDPTQFF